MQHVAPHLADRLKRYEPGPDDGDDVDVFGRFRIDEQIAKALERKVFLPSGGSLVIDRTEAMTVIDVNTGKFTGSGGNLEATVTSNNLEAAEEIVRQLRLRDVGGIIVIDFIDMVLPANRELLLRRLVECLGRDRTRHQVAEVTSLGLVQMTRKKIGTGLLEAFSSECPVCHGRGYEIHDEPVDSQRQADGGAREQRGGPAATVAARGNGGARERQAPAGGTAVGRQRLRQRPRHGPAGAAARAVRAQPWRPRPRVQTTPRATRSLGGRVRRHRPGDQGRRAARHRRGGRLRLVEVDVRRGRQLTLAVAVVGAGPSGVYAAEALTRQPSRPRRHRRGAGPAAGARSAWSATASRPTTRRSAPSAAPSSGRSTRRASPSTATCTSAVT